MSSPAKYRPRAPFCHVLPGWRSGPMRESVNAVAGARSCLHGMAANSTKPGPYFPSSLPRWLTTRLPCASVPSLIVTRRGGSVLPFGTAPLFSFAGRCARKFERLLGFTPRRVKALRYGEAKRIEEREMRAVRAATTKQQVRDAHQQAAHLEAMAARLAAADPDFHASDIENARALSDRLRNLVR